jgi:hypothetical protein
MKWKHSTMMTPSRRNDLYTPPSPARPEFEHVFHWWMRHPTLHRDSRLPPSPTEEEATTGLSMRPPPPTPITGENTNRHDGEVCPIGRGTRAHMIPPLLATPPKKLDGQQSGSPSPPVASQENPPDRHRPAPQYQPQPGTSCHRSTSRTTAMDCAMDPTKAVKHQSHPTQGCVAADLALPPPARRRR